MLGELAGKSAFITGGSSGIGLGLAHVLAEAGMHVAIGYRSPDHRDSAMAEFESGQNVVPIEVDVADRKSLDRAAAAVSDRFGKLHFLACNAGVFFPAPLMATTDDDWDWEIGINLTGTFNTLKAFVPGMLDHGEAAHIVATGSILGFVGAKAAPAYAASKFGLVGMMESLAAELEETNVGVTIFCPGFVSTNVADWRRSRGHDAVNTGGTDANPSTWTDPALTMDTLTAARHLLDAVLAGQLHAIPNWEYGEALEARSQIVAKGLGNESLGSAERAAFGKSFLSRSIYSRLRTAPGGPHSQTLSSQSSNRLSRRGGSDPCQGRRTSLQHLLRSRLGLPDLGWSLVPGPAGTGNFAAEARVANSAIIPHPARRSAMVCQR